MANIEVVQLTDTEKVLHDSIIWDDRELMNHPFEERIKCLDNLSLLAKSLLERDAIPQVRMDQFTQPGLGGGKSKKSPQQIFESNGTVGENIFRHPHFIKHLRYFIYGPELPSHVVVEFCNIIEDDLGHSGTALKNTCAFVRKYVRSHCLDNKNKVADEFFKLACEVGHEDIAAIIREEAKSVPN